MNEATVKPIGKIEVESEHLDRILNTLSDDEYKRKLLYKSVWVGAKALQSTTKQYFRNALGESAAHYSKYIKAPFEDGITISGDKAYLEAKVSIMKDFRLKFFEKGTEERYTGVNGHSDLIRGRHNKDNAKATSLYRGRIAPKHFFRDARNDSVNNVENIMKNVISEELSKL